MTTEYILDLDKEEYRDDFVSNANNEFWQFEARDSLIEKLTTTLHEAKSYKIARQKKTNKTWLSHNAILVSGQRGTGKTVFLRNCEDIWKNSNSNSVSHEQSDLYFLHEIDPTMLINEDNFSNVVVAQIYSEVERKLQFENSCKNQSATLDKHKSTFHKALKKLADSLGKQEDFNGFTGIDKIQQYKSGIHIQSYFHEFIEASIDILGCSALVLPIDDVDMALDRAFEVVDDVRRLLGCPYIIPIVSGDYRLYSQMTNVHFDEKSYRDESANPELINEGQELAKQLTNAYLTKIFPNQMRITLLPILYITPTLTIKQNFDGKVRDYTFKDYKYNLLQKFYPLCHNKEVLDSWPKPDSARELTQLIRALSPSKFKESLNENSSKSTYKLWKSYINWSEQKQNGVAFSNANSYLSLVNRDPAELFDIQELANFNPKQQMIKELYPWAQKDFYNSQVSALGFLNTSSDDKLSQASKDSRTIIDSAFDKNSLTLRSMPPLEFIDTKSFVTLDVIDRAILGAELVNTSIFSSSDNSEVISENIESGIEFKIEQVLFDLYTHGDTYSSLQNTYQYVFMSRAFEVIFYSFINNSLEKQEEDLLHILNRTPFYSVFNMAPTKSILSEEEGNPAFSNIPNSKRPSRQNSSITAQVLNELIHKWKKQHKALFLKFDSKLLIPIFAYIFNKSFTALNIFKQEVFSKATFGQKSETSEHLTDFAKRFEYILINSAYTAAIQGSAVQANVAFTDNHNTIRSPGLFNRSDNVLRRNRRRFREEMDSSISNLHETADLFILALEDHPIFTIIQKKGKGRRSRITIPEKIKMGKVNNVNDFLSESGQLLPNFRIKVNDFLNKNKQISGGGVSKVNTFIQNIYNDSEAEEFYKKNIENSPDKLKELNSITGDKEHNFIVALIIFFANN